MTDDPIGDELHKLAEEFKRVVGETTQEENEEETTLEKLAEFGLTCEEGKAWLKHEPSFPSDVSYHGGRNRRKVTRTHFLSINMVHTQGERRTQGEERAHRLGGVRGFYGRARPLRVGIIYYKCCCLFI
jgi:hypothetical protein